MIKISDPGIKTKYTVTDFENTIKEYVGYPYAVATNTGTAALYLALLDSGARHKKIKIPALCFRAVYNASQAIGEVVFGDDWYVAINVMNYGFPDKHKTTRHDILDAAEAFGGDIPKDYQYVILSFNWNKPVTCGSGGMVLCREKRSEWYIRGYANHWKVDPVYFIHDYDEGFNFRMNDLQATMGMESFNNLLYNTAMRKKNFLRYLDAGLPVVKPPKEFKWNYWITLLQTPKRDKIIQAFQKNDIEARAMFTPHTREFPEVNKYAAQTMCLPSSPSLMKEEQDKVICIVKECL